MNTKHPPPPAWQMIVGLCLTAPLLAYTGFEQEWTRFGIAAVIFVICAVALVLRSKVQP